MKKEISNKKGRVEKDGRQRILLAAIDEFSRAGLAGAKLDVIALEAGVSKQLIHHYFRTKAELYIAVIDEVSGRQIEQLVHLDYESCTPEKAMVMFFEKVFDSFIDWPFMAGIYNDQSLYNGEHIPRCRDLIALSPDLMVRLEAVITRGQESGVFRKDIEVKESIAAALMVVIGGFTNGPLLSSLIPIDFSDEGNVNDWRKFSIEFSLRSFT